MTHYLLSCWTCFSIYFLQIPKRVRNGVHFFPEWTATSSLRGAKRRSNLIKEKSPRKRFALEKNGLLRTPVMLNSRFWPHSFTRSLGFSIYFFMDSETKRAVNCSSSEWRAFFLHFRFFFVFIADFDSRSVCHVFAQIFLTISWLSL